MSGYYKNTPKRKIVKRMGEQVILECRHVTNERDKRYKSIYCFDCFKGKPSQFSDLGITETEFLAYCDESDVAPNNEHIIEEGNPHECMMARIFKGVVPCINSAFQEVA